MNALIQAGSEPITMTSLELVEFINSQRAEGEPELTHANFLAKVPKVLGETSHSFECDLPDSYGRPRKGFRFPKREACLMAMSYSYDLQAKVFDRMTAMESALQAKPASANLSRMELIQIAMQAEQERLQLEGEKAAVEAKLEVAAPKAAALDRIADTDGLLNPTCAAKALQVPPHRVFQFMRTTAWVYRRAGGKSDVAYQDKIAAGYLTHKVHIARREDGSEKVCEQVMVTPKGLAKLAEHFQREGAHT